MKYILLALLCMTAYATVSAVSAVFLAGPIGTGRSFVGLFLFSLFILARLKGSLKTKHLIVCAAISWVISVVVPLFYIFVLFWSVNYSGLTVFSVPVPLIFPILVPALGSVFVWFCCFYSGAAQEPVEQHQED